MSMWVAPELKDIAPTGVLSQIDEFERGGGKLGPTDVVILCAASNDLFGASRNDKAEWNRRVVAASANLQAVLERLGSLGARRIVVINRLPRASGDFADDADINAAIAALVSNPAMAPGAKVAL